MRGAIICAYLAEQANYLLGRIDQKDKKCSWDQRTEIENAKVLIAESLGAISVIGRDGATQDQLKKFNEFGERMNKAVRF